MKKYLSDMAKPRLFTHDLIFGFAGVLLFLTLLSVWLVSGLFAKYTFSDQHSDNARVAKGLPVPEILEHRAELVNGEYKLVMNEEVNQNFYRQTIPGVDIPKDTVVRISRSSEVKYELFLKVHEENFPTMKSSGKTVNAVNYMIDTTNWEKVPGKDDEYKYKGTIKVGEDINIIRDNMLYVSDHYNGNGKTFSLGFEAWISQID